MHANEVKKSVSCTRKGFPLIVNSVFENVLVCAQFSLKLANFYVAQRLWFIMQLFRF